MPYIDPESVLWKEIDGKVVVLLISSGTFCELNKIGSIIWKLLAAGNNTDSIIAQIAATHDISGTQLSTDVHEFMKNMIAQGLVRE